MLKGVKVAFFLIFFLEYKMDIKNAETTPKKLFAKNVTLNVGNKMLGKDMS